VADTAMSRVEAVECIAPLRPDLEGGFARVVFTDLDVWA